MKILSLLSLILISLALMAQNSPNIIFILTDDQGWNHVSYLSDPAIADSKSDYYETPNMERFAKAGIRFTQGYAPNPICAPTRNSLLFGQNAARHIYNKDTDWFKKADQKLTIPKAIKMADPDYLAAHFGKWHIAMRPDDAGYDEYDGLTSNSDGDIFGDDIIDARKFNEETDRILRKTDAPNPLGLEQSGKPSMYWNDENPKDIFGITKRGMNFMDRCITAGKPFYLQLSHYATHLALSAREETYEYFIEKEKGKVHESAEFAAMLKDMDEGIGMIMDYVEAKGIEDNTYIFILSDNGGRTTFGKVAVINENKQIVDAFYPTTDIRNEPLRDGKHSFYEGGLRVPFMAAGPGIAQGRVCDVPVTGLDLLPTFCQLAGYDKTLKGMDGGSLVNLIFNEDIKKVKRPQEALIFHQGSHRKPESAIRVGDYKLVKFWEKDPKYEGTPRVELFDLSKDPFEKKDISGTNKKMTNKLLKELLKSLEEYGAITESTDVPSALSRCCIE